jgi:pimeloyl-ACP methyl ester carboxylesterase
MDTSKNTTLENTINSNLIMSSLLQTEGSAAISDTGAGRPMLLLHGGGGPGTMFGLSQALNKNARVLLPTHPGFEGTARPARFDSVKILARFYVDLLEALHLDDVILIGSSVGGWIAAEMAIAGAGRIKGLVLMNAVGIDVPGEAIADVSGLTPPALARLAHHNPELMLANLPPMTPERMAIRMANFAALVAYGHGPTTVDPELRAKLATVQAPALVVWGESDRIVSPAYGKSFADAFANGKYIAIAEAGHLPHIEQAARVHAQLDDFIATLDAAA